MAAISRIFFGLFFSKKLCFGCDFPYFFGLFSKTLCFATISRFFSCLKCFFFCQGWDHRSWEAEKRHSKHCFAFSSTDDITGAFCCWQTSQSTCEKVSFLSMLVNSKLQFIPVIQGSGTIYCKPGQGQHRGSRLVGLNDWTSCQPPYFPTTTTRRYRESDEQLRPVVLGKHGEPRGGGEQHQRLQRLRRRLQQQGARAAVQRRQSNVQGFHHGSFQQASSKHATQASCPCRLARSTPAPDAGIYDGQQLVSPTTTTASSWTDESAIK